MKLLIVYLLVWFSFDKLKLYAFLMFFVVFLITLIYVVYCRIKFYECRMIAAKDKCLYISLFNLPAGTCSEVWPMWVWIRGLIFY